MRYACSKIFAIRTVARLAVVGALVLTCATALEAQSTPPISPFALPSGAAQAAQQAAPSGPVRRLSVDEAVNLALENNLGIQAERKNPQIQDLVIAETRSAWTPALTSEIVSASTDTPVTSTFSGGQNSVNDGRFQTTVGIKQFLPTGTNYTIGWDSLRSTSTNFFNNYDPQLRSNLSFNISQPFFRNYKIDSTRQQLQINEKTREVADVNLRANITQTMRNVKNAYWDLVFAVDNLGTQHQSLDLSRRLLADNEKRVQIGTMAPLDIVEAQAEVARNQEAVIVAEAAIKQAEDRLRVLVLDSRAPDFWEVSIEPTDTAAVPDMPLNLDSAVQRAIGVRSEVLQSRNSMQQTDVNIRFFQNQLLPDVNAVASYGLVGVGGALLQPLSLASLGGGSIPARSVVSQRSYGAALGDVFTNAYPAWTIGVQIGYPIGRSTAEAGLARARLQYSQAEAQLKNTELQIASQVRDVARQVRTNRQRVDTTRVARELAERRLDAEEKKFAAGIQTSFFVFQAQRDLATARDNEVKAILDYNKSLVDFDAVQEVPLTTPSQASPLLASQAQAAVSR